MNSEGGIVIDSFEPEVLAIPKHVRKAWKKARFKIMGRVLTALTDEQANMLRILDGWDLSRVKKHMGAYMGLSKRTLDELEREYKRFIAINLLFPGHKMPIASAVDKMWHAHILHTRDYVDFGIAVAGCYMHHKPTVNKAEALKLETPFRERTLAFYQKTFGKPDLTVWQESVCGYNGDCNYDE